MVKIINFCLYAAAGDTLQIWRYEEIESKMMRKIYKP